MQKLIHHYHIKKISMIFICWIIFFSSPNSEEYFQDIDSLAEYSSIPSNEFNFKGNEDYLKYESSGSIKKGLKYFFLMFPFTFVMNMGSLVKDAEDLSKVSGGLICALWSAQVASSFFLGYFRKTDRFQVKWYAGGNISSYYNGESYMFGLNGGLYSAFRIIKGLSTGFELALVTTKDVQLYTPYTIAYTFDIANKHSVFASIGLGRTYHIYDHNYHPDKGGDGFEFLKKYSMLKGTLAYEGEKHSIYLSLYFDEFFSNETIAPPKILGISYGRKF